MIANVALVIVVDMVCFFCGTFIAGVLGGFAAAFSRMPNLIALTGLLGIPAIMIVGHFAGRWIARRQPPPTAIEIIIGCVLYTSVSTVLAAFAHPAAAAVSLIAGAAISFVLYRSAQQTSLGAAVTANRAWKVLLVRCGFLDFAFRGVGVEAVTLDNGFGCTATLNRDQAAGGQAI